MLAGQQHQRHFAEAVACHHQPETEAATQQSHYDRNAVTEIKTLEPFQDGSKDIEYQAGRPTQADHPHQEGKGRVFDVQQCADAAYIRPAYG